LISKKKLTAVVSALVLSTLLLPQAAMGMTLRETAAANGIDLTQKAVFQVGNKTLLNEDTGVAMDIEPFLENDRTYVPVRYFGEALGGEVHWDSVTKQITITLPNGSKFDVTNVVILRNNRSFMPLNLMRTKLNMTVDWIGGQQLIVIHKDTLTIDTKGEMIVWKKDPFDYGKDLGNGVIDVGCGFGIGGTAFESVSDAIPGTGYKF